MILKRDDRPNPVLGGTGAYGVKVEAARPQKNTRWLLFSNDQRVRVQPTGGMSAAMTISRNSNRNSGRSGQAPPE